MPGSEYPDICFGSDIHSGDLWRFIESIQSELSSKRGGPQLLGQVDQSKIVREFAEAANEDVFFRGIFWEGSLGGLIWAAIHVDNFNRRFCLINVLAVRKDLRGKGLGRQLYVSCEEWSSSKGAKGIEMQVLPGDRDAKNFCESKGLVARSLIMYKPLDG